MSKYLPDKEKTNLATIRAAFEVLESDLGAIRATIGAIDIPALPDGIAMKSDIPAQQDLTSIYERMEELSVALDEITGLIPGSEEINTLAEARAEEMLAPIRASLESVRATMSTNTELAIANQTAQHTTTRDLSETRRWLSEMGRAWQTHKATVKQQVQSVESRVVALTDALAAMESRACPDMPDVAGIAAEMQEIRSTLTEITGGES